jgi:hypothetical protein
VHPGAPVTAQLVAMDADLKPAADVKLAAAAATSKEK